jgi:hypothetical protein
MKIDLNTPSLLFPAISLLLLAYTNRFLAIASLVRNLYHNYQESKEEHLLIQIKSLRRRLLLIRNMQFFGILAILLCVTSMFAIFAEANEIGKYMFGTSLVMMIISLFFSLWELLKSIYALDVELQDLAKKKRIKN